jgi:hypothetical protein
MTPIRPENLDRKVIQEIQFDTVMTAEYMLFLNATLPRKELFSHDKPEWSETPIIELDLTSFGYGKVYVKDESSKASNPTGTIKDRRSYELGPRTYRIFIDNIVRSEFNLQHVIVPRFSDLTAGNIGLSQSMMNQKWGLPPPKILVGSEITTEILDELKGKWLDIYQAPLDINIFSGTPEPYTPEQINIITNNRNGHNITGSRIVESHKDFYDWHWVQEIFNFNPDEVYGPYGSGEWFANGITWQRLLCRNPIKDQRFKKSPEEVSRISILGAQPENKESKATKLNGFMPFQYYSENDFNGSKLMFYTGENTGIHRLGEDYLELAYRILDVCGIQAEISAAAGLGLYLQRYDAKLVNPDHKVLIVNTGKGV